MHPLEILQDEIESVFDDVECQLDLAEIEGGRSFLDVWLDEYHLNVVHVEGLAFGVTASPDDVGFGEGPAEIFCSFDTTRSRVLELMRYRDYTYGP